MSYSTSSSFGNSENNYNPLFNSQSSGDFEINNYSSNSAYEAPPGANPYPPSADEYNPEQELDTWEPDAPWQQSGPAETDTPESPPLFEKEGYGDPIEYHDTVTESGIEDIDQRVLPIIPIESDDSLGRGHDIDHRNLISLTGSPADSNSNLPSSEAWNSQDQDYRTPPVTSANMDQDYRVPPFNIEQLKLPPPPPPPPKSLLTPIPTITTITTTPLEKDKTGPKMLDIVESIDMDLSDDDNMLAELQKADTTNLKVVVDNVDDSTNEALLMNEDSQSPNDASFSQLVLEPPPPFPDLPDDEDANNFLDDLDNDLNSNEFATNLADDFPDIPTDEFMQDDLFDNVDDISMSFPNLPNMQLNLPPNLPNLQNMSDLHPNNITVPRINDMPGNQRNMPGNLQNMPGNLQNMPSNLQNMSMNPQNMSGNHSNVPSMPPPPPMMSMPPIDWGPDQPMNAPMPVPNFPFRGRGFARGGNGNFRGNFNNMRGNFNNQMIPLNNQPFNNININNNRGNFHNNRGNFNNNRGSWDHRGRGRGRGGNGGFRGGRGRGNFRGNFRGGF